MAHTFDVSKADRLEDTSRYRYCSREELIGLLDPEPGDRIVDVGSGTGFYTRDVAPVAGRILGLDVQRGMHDLFSEQDVPENVALLTADAGAVPIDTSSVDAVFATMTFHEIAPGPALREVARVVRPGGRFVVVDWSAEGEGESGPPLGERTTCREAKSMLDSAGFAIERSRERPETFALVAVVGE